ncbi:MAG: hypothetical protein ACR2HH_06650 [Chthoniobacterales bacterium]
MKERGHETRDISARVVAWFAVGLVLAALLIYPAVIGLYKLFEHQNPSPDAPSRIALDPHMIAPAPRLQTAPAVDLDKFNAAENAKLNSYGWVDKSVGLAHIPIERAMDLIAQRGLPTRGPGTQNSSGKTPEELQKQKAEATKP